MSDKILKLSQAQTLYQDLRERVDALPTNEDIPEVPVQDITLNGVTALANGVAKLEGGFTKDSNNNIKVYTITAYGTNLSGGGENTPKALQIVKAPSSEIKKGTENYRPIVPLTQHESTFYGLAKAAGADMANIANTTVGIYPDAQKEAIQSMLGITQMLAPENPNLIASQAYAVGEVFAANGHLYKATAAIAQDEAIIPDTNCVETTMADESVRDIQVNGASVLNNGVAEIPIASNSVFGVTKGNTNQGIGVDSVSKNLYISQASESQVKAGANTYKPITPSNEHFATFYGLSKVAGVDLANETVTLGTYPETSKTAIKEMLGVQDGLKVVRLI